MPDSERFKAAADRVRDALQTLPGDRHALLGDFAYVRFAAELQARTSLASVDPSGGKASYWLTRAANLLDHAVQCCGTEDSEEINAMEERCDELAAKLREQGN